MSRNKVSKKIEMFLLAFSEDFEPDNCADMLNTAIDEIDRLNNKIQELSVYIESAAKALEHVND